MPISLNQLPGLGALNQASQSKATPEEKAEAAAPPKRSGPSPGQGAESAVTLEVSGQARPGNEMPGAAVEVSDQANGGAQGLAAGDEMVRGLGDDILKNVAAAVRAQASGLAPTAHRLV